MVHRSEQDRAWSNVHVSRTKSETICDRVVARLVIEHTPSAGSVLDLGAGVGTTLSLIRRLAPTLHLEAADVSNDCLEQIRNRIDDIETHLIDETVDSYNALGEAHFDCCLLSHVLEHTYRPLDSLLAALRLVKPGGYLIVAVPNPACPLFMVASLFRFHYVNRGHVQAWDHSHWKNFLENIAQVDVTGYFHDEVRVFPYRLGRMRPFKAIERALSMAAPWWSQSHIAVISRKAH